MDIKIKFFGILAETTGIEEKIIDLASNTNTDAVKLHFESLYPKLKNQNFQLAINQQIAKANTNIKQGDEIAFLPPFAGG
jgi:molybdopterin synthase sulfur carrier subunit